MSVPLNDEREAIAGRISSASHILLFCDFDGALAPVFDRPSQAALSPEVCRPLAELAATDRVTVIVVSGRAADDLIARACVPNMIAVGNHGLQIVGPDWTYTDPAVLETVPHVNAPGAALAKAVESIPAAVVEDKGLSASVHFRNVASEQHEAVRTSIHGVLSSTTHPFVLTIGRMVFDLRPRVYWNKASAVRWIAERVGRPDALVVFVGGDPTDEEAFAALTDGVTVRIGSGLETSAKYHLDGPDGVRYFLEWICDQVR